MITVTDLFCGAGGSSSGLTTLPGVRVVMAANHWKLAIDSHQANHPNTDHDSADISQVEPSRFPTTDILWASPECTNHSVAKGIKRQRAVNEALFEMNGTEPLPDEAAVRSRATMWDVPRFAEYHHYKAIIIENVVDAYRWIPFPAWLQTMELLGYEHEIVWLNSMHAQGRGMPAPQSRDRMYVVFWLKGNRKPDLGKWTRPRAVCETHGDVLAVQVFKKAERWGRYRAQYVYKCPKCAVTVEPAWLPAASAIDWSIRGTRIGDRQKPLSPKTMTRIKRGIDRYWNAPPRPPIITDGIRGEGTVQSGLDPLLTQTTAQTKGVLIPVVVPLRNNGVAKLVTDPIDTVSAGGNHHALLINNVSGADASRSRPINDPMPTVVSGGFHASLLVPYYGNGNAAPVSEPHRALTTVDRYSLLSNQTDVEDCEFRMLTPDEIKVGMAFAADYILLGNKREQVKQSGNAVTPPAARDLGAAVIESLGVQLDRELVTA